MSQDNSDEIAHLYDQLFALSVIAADLFVTKGATSPEFAEAIGAAEAICQRIRNLTGTTGEP